MDGGACNQCKSLTIGASFILNAASKNQKLAAEMLNEMATPEMGTLWLETILLQTAIKSDPSKVRGKYAEYFQELLAAEQRRASTSSASRVTTSRGSAATPSPRC